LTCVNGTNTSNLTGDPNLGALTGSPAYFPLNVGSSAINTGSNALVPFGITLDQAGNPRISGGTVDRGAFEFATTATTLTLQLTLQSRPAPPTTQHVATVHVQLRPTAGGVAVWSGDATSNTSGQVTLSGLPTGTYTLWVKGTHTLARTQAITLGASANTGTTAVLLEGDTNDSNLINVTDFSLLATAFGKTTGQVGFNSQADFNGDGIVNVTDFSLLATNFNQSGAL